MQKWSENFRWYFINWAFRKTRYIDNDADMDQARAEFSALAADGVLSAPPNKDWRRLRDNILAFIQGDK